MILSRRRFDTACTVEVEHSFAHLHAHVDLDGDIKLAPGDRVCVQGERVVVPFGGSIRERRMATVVRAYPWERLLMRIKARFALTELYEIGFSPGDAR